jgi:hypothetical protein
MEDTDQSFSGRQEVHWSGTESFISAVQPRTGLFVGRNQRVQGAEKANEQGPELPFLPVRIQ